MPSIRLLVADDHDILRTGLRDMLEGEPGWSVVAEAANGTQAVELALELKPDIAVLDVGMPDLNGFEATRRIREALPATEVLILTAHDSEQLVREAEVSGARGYLLKSDLGRDLIAAVESVHKHRFFLSPQMAKRSNGEPGSNGHPPILPRLTAREREIIQLLAEGHVNKDIATRLNISVKTAETHRTNIMRKIDVHSLPDLTRFAIRNHLVEP
ncbi:MAG TPA: response regulator transcription factor [Terriglobia bacterium]|nr:response regulator transcription factor [Terriglobia bacterium]